MAHINRSYNDHQNGIHIDKGTEVEVIDFVAKHDGKEWVEVEIRPTGERVTVLADAVSA